MSAYVLLHGYAGSPAAWDEVRAALPSGSRVLCPALVGHAPDTGPARDFESEIARLARLIAAAGLEHAHLCGYSLGGRLALGLLIRHPGLFSRATLIGAHPGLPEGDPVRLERAAADERWATIAERQGAAAFADQWAAQPLFASQRALAPEVAAKQAAARARLDGKALAAAMRALSLARMPDWGPSLTGVALPVQLIAGALDDKFVALARAMAGRIPGARLTIVPGAGHNVLIERPSAIIAALLAG